jgi:hypothetical protein
MGTKISGMTLVTPTGTEELEVNAAGATKKVTAQAIANLAPPPSVAAASVSFSNAASGLAATNVQTALNEIDADVDALQAAPAPTAATVSYSNTTSGLSATTVQAAIDQTDARVDTLAGATAPTAATVSFSNTTSGLSATTVQAALDQTDARVDALVAAPAPPPKVIQLACSDETTALAAGTGKATFRMPYAMTVSAVRASLTTAQASGSIFTVDINEAGTSIISTKLTIDNTEKTSVTAATAPVISDASLADDAEITVDIDQIGDGTAKGLKVTLIGA